MSTRGRHRRHRPSTVSRASLRVTAGGAGIAIPLVGAQVAQAAPADIWQKVAACESGNRWDVNTGNGFFGGLQFSRSTWQAYGGTAYAPRADQATRGEQVAVAEKVLAGQGPRAWPHCGPAAGLARGGPRPQGERAGRPAAAEQPRDAVRQREHERAREEDRAQRAARATAERRAKATTYEVVSGDSLSAIAADRDVRGGWQQLYAHNRSTVGSDPDLIFPGQRLALDGAARSRAQDGRGPQKAGAEQRARAEEKSAKETAGDKTARAAEAARAAKEKAAKEKAAKEKATGRTQAKATAGGAGGAAAVVAPVSGYRVTTGYQASGGSWSSGHHTGIDFPVPTGTTVKAMTRGTVVSAGWGDAYGYQVVLRHADGRYSQYGHLSAISVRAGQPVAAGQRIGRSGATGNATGPHLHFEVRTGPGYGSDVDPLAYLRGHGVHL